LVESQTSARTPSSPIERRVCVLDGSPSTGVSSSFQSPVWKIRPCGVSISSSVALRDRVGERRHSGSRTGRARSSPSHLDDVELHLAGQPLLLQLAGDQAGGEGSRVERHLQIGGEIGKRADMVLMAVGQDDPEQVGRAAPR
jgi:hypothetical protein